LPDGRFLSLNPSLYPAVVSRDCHWQ
jgi:hypothetical protein